MLNDDPCRTPRAIKRRHIHDDHAVGCGRMNGIVWFCSSSFISRRCANEAKFFMFSISFYRLIKIAFNCDSFFDTLKITGNILVFFISLGPCLDRGLRIQAPISKCRLVRGSS